MVTALEEKIKTFLPERYLLLTEVFLCKENPTKDGQSDNELNSITNRHTIHLKSLRAYC